jgi:hypothetical protein
LFVLVRPFQVTPPWQSFRGMGGVSRISTLFFREGTVFVNETARLVPVSASSSVCAPERTDPRFGALTFDDGFMATWLSGGSLPPQTEAVDSFGFATGALEFELLPDAEGFCEATVTSLPTGLAHAPMDPPFDWGVKLPVSQWAGEGWIADAISAALTATAHILVTRSGPALQPGPRRYTRSWIRDGAMMSGALLRMGLKQEVREFIDWYAPHQRSDGFVPCCVDAEGIDWLVEHDSHGQLIALIADYHAFAADEDFLRQMWPFVAKAAGCIECLLDATGLLPISVSHEGYLAQPVHSYWDDFWALRGLHDAADLAGAMGDERSGQRWRALGMRFGASLFASIEATRARRGLSFIPGSIEWADFDPTATANALYLHDVPGGLDRGAVDHTFDVYLADWRGKRSGAVQWANYTPYEIRIIGAMVRLGRRDDALELLRFFLADRRPLAWNQWPEIAWHDTAAPAHIGDVPHTWIAGEFVLAVRCLFAYEREADRALILGAGLAAEWIEGAGVRVTDMPTLYGTLSYSLSRIDAMSLRLEIGAGIGCKLVLRPPLGAALRSVTVDGISCTSFDDDSVTIGHTPAVVIFAA